MSAMDINSLETDENSTDQIDDNLLEPMSEVSFTEREKNFTMSSKPPTNNEKDSSSLPDARAKMLHLQRIARSGDSSSSDTVKSTSSSSQKRNKSQSVDTNNEKEETVSFSLESIIRRGLNEQKIKSNFNSNFKFGKPDDNISLRCNPTANLFYEHSNDSGSDSTSDTYESSGERENTENKPITMMKNGVAENGVNDKKPEPKKRGRPKMTDEQKSLRAAQKEALRLQNQNTINSSSTSQPTQVDELMAMGHSMFSEIQPRKRGRPRVKPREFNEEFSSFLESTSTTQDEQNSQDESLALNDSAPEPKVHKKRGRKPKSYYLELARLNETAPTRNNDSSISHNERASTSLPATGTLAATGPKKRGRKPKYLENYYVKLEQTSLIAQQPAQENDNDTVDETVDEADVDAAVVATTATPPLKKKRGRKPKSFYLQQVKNERLNETAPAALEQLSSDGPPNGDRPPPTQSIDLLLYAKRRGRKPKAYYEQLAALGQDNRQNTSLISNNTISTKKGRPSVSFADTSTLSDGPPAKKKRGRKPKSYYLELQQQEDQEQSKLVMAHQSTPLNHTAGSSSSQNYPNIGNEEQNSINSPIAATEKQVPKSSMRQFIHNRRAYVKRVLPYTREPFRRPGLEIPAPGIIIKQKRGRKPKNYQPNVEQQYGPIESNEYSQRYLNDNPIASQRAPANNLQASEDRNRILMELLQRQSDEIRMLKQRMSNLIIENDVNDVNDVNDECINASTSLPWTNSELCKAFCLQRLNIPLFNHLRKKFSVPLPSVDEVRKFIRNIQFVRELQPTILQILEYDGQILQDHEKFTILQVSYIKTADIFEYDESSDLIWGPHKFFAVIVARGLYKEWSQVVYMNFDTRVTKANLINVIEALHRISYPVVAVSANFEEGRNDIFHELSIGYGKNFFSHPLTTEKIFCFYYLNDLLQATNTHFCAGNLQLDETNSTDTTQRSKHILSKQTVLLAIQNSYRKIPIPKELLAWTDNNVKRANVIEKLFSQYTMNLLQLTLPNDRSTKHMVEFISIMKSFGDIMSRNCVYDDEADVPNFDSFIEFQNKKLTKVHARLFKLEFVNATEPGKKFREAMLMSVVSLTMLRKALLPKHKYPTFSTAAITEEILRTKFDKIISKHNYERVMPPMLVFRIIKDIFFGENCAIKIEPTVKFFYNGAVTAAEINGRNETYYVSALIQWLCDEYLKRNPNTNDVKELKRKLKKAEENFCHIQNPNFRICENVVKKMTKKLDDGNENGSPISEIIRLYVMQRHLLRIKYFNENRITRIPMPVQMTITLEE